MNFASKAFFIFLPFVLIVFHLLPGRERKFRFLLLASWFFYLSWDPRFIWVILLSTSIVYLSALRMERSAAPASRRLWLLLTVVVNLGMLGFFKYTNFLLGTASAAAGRLGYSAADWSWHIVLPIGISFYTFQGISYALDVYRGKMSAVRNFLDFSLYVAFFPQLVAGPIVRASEMLPQMASWGSSGGHSSPTERAIDGLHWFLLGLFKKLFLADRLADFVVPVFADPGQFDAATLRWAVLAYAAQIYCDFSGYSDIAIGCAKWFGFDLPINFHFPYLAVSIADFWKRWHITLSSWMRDYLYIPLGGSRAGAGRVYFNLVLTMTLCGLWHGAQWNYVLWGFYNGVLLAGHRLYDRALGGTAWLARLRENPAFRAAAIFGTFMVVAAGLIMVSSKSWEGFWLVEQAWWNWGADIPGRHWVPSWVPVLVGMVAAGHLFSGWRGLRCGIRELPLPLRAGAYVVAVVLLVVFAPSAAKDFVYFVF